MWGVNGYTSLKHKFDFADAENVFAGMTYTFADDRIYYGEDRFITIGMLKGGIVLIAHTEQGDEVRIISMGYQHKPGH